MAIQTDAPIQIDSLQIIYPESGDDSLTDSTRIRSYSRNAPCKSVDNSLKLWLTLPKNGRSVIFFEKSWKKCILGVAGFLWYA